MLGYYKWETASHRRSAQREVDESTWQVSIQ